jgi:tripartite-type tricarboxylate transporter receptor subunit TctC
MMGMRALLLKATGVILAAMTALGGHAPAAAQDYPTKPVRIIVAFSPGGINDTIARLVAAQLSERLGKQFIVENKPGAGGVIAGEALVNAPKDGHTLLVVSLAIAVNPHVYKMPYDPRTAFAPIAILASAPNVLSVNDALPAKSVKELVALAKAKPGDLRYASAGLGSFMHLGPELFKMLAGVDIQHVPFKGGGPALIDVMGGDTHMSFASAVTTTPHIRSGKLRALGVGGTKRSAALPDVPTIAEAGVPGYECANWIGFAAPAGTPAPIIALLHKELTRAQESPQMKKMFANDGAEPVRMSSAEFGAFIVSEIDKWGKVVRQSGMKQK